MFWAGFYLGSVAGIIVGVGGMIVYLTVILDSVDENAEPEVKNGQ